MRNNTAHAPLQSRATPRLPTTPRSSVPNHGPEAALQQALTRFLPVIVAELRRTLQTVNNQPNLQPFYGQMAYHLGWVDAQFQPTASPPGKLMRPALVLWGCELAAAASGAAARTRAKRRQQALPVAAAVELLHNFSLIHDDIEDRDTLRRFRPTVWSLWGEAQGINTGDGMFCVMRLALWEVLAQGVPAKLAVQMAQILDRTALTLCEGQFLDMTFEAQATITTDAYLDMIGRKTAALMQAAPQLGALVGAPAAPHLAEALGMFGRALGVGFQLRDDMLGIWEAHTALGKSAAGDLRRKKMSLPVIYALGAASATDRACWQAIYARTDALDDDAIDQLLLILERVEARAWCQRQLADQCARARAALDGIVETTMDPAVSPAAEALGSMVAFVATAAHA